MVRSSFVCALACAVSYCASMVSVAVASPAEDVAHAHEHVHEHEGHAVEKADAATGGIKESADEALAKADEKVRLADGLGIAGAAEAKGAVADAKAAVDAADSAAALVK